MPKNHHQTNMYAAKHAPDTVVNAAIAADVQRLAKDGKITCAQAHLIAREREVSLAEVGQTLDLLEIRISRCQLGIFPKRRTGDSPEENRDFLPAFLAELESRADSNRTLTCRAVWELAEQHRVSRAAAGAACNALRIKIVICQIGAF